MFLWDIDLLQKPPASILAVFCLSDGTLMQGLPAIVQFWAGAVYEAKKGWLKDAFYFNNEYCDEKGC